MERAESGLEPLSQTPVLVCSGCCHPCHRPGGFYHRHLLLARLEAGKSEVKAPSDSVPAESPGPRCSLTVSSQGSAPLCSASSPVSSSKVANPISRATPSCSHGNQMAFQRPHLQVPAQGEGGTSTQELGRDTGQPGATPMFLVPPPRVGGFRLEESLNRWSWSSAFLSRGP